MTQKYTQISEKFNIPQQDIKPSKQDLEVLEKDKEFLRELKYL